MKADVYKNLQTGGYSIRSRETETYGQVVSHEDAVVVKDVDFVVNKAGRKKVLKEERKNVHAFVRGCIAPIDEWRLVEDEIIEIRYNPYEFKNFVNSDTETAVNSADIVLLNDSGVFATI
jgi:hypothetical protein